MKNQIILSNLKLQNFATFENQEILFTDSFNAIVGETGSGKSLILDALQLIFGARADKGLIRKGSSFATIEAIFNCNDSTVISYFDSIGYPFEDDEINIRRVIYDNGRTRSFLNHQSCPLSVLTAFSREFVDLVGQFENQKLLSEDYQLSLLDTYANINFLVKEYSAVYNSYQTLSSRLKDLILRKEQRAQREDFLTFQLGEIAKLDPAVEDEENLLKEKEVLTKKEQKRELVSKVISTLSGDNRTNLITSLQSLIFQLEKEHDLISSSDIDKLHSAHHMLEEVSYNLSKELDGELNSTKIEKILDRLDLYQKLKRRFGGTTENLLQAQNEFQHEYQELMQLEKQITELEEQIDQHEKELSEKAQQLHESRLDSAAILSHKITDGVRKLMMTGATIHLEVHKKSQLGPSGFSFLNFIAETNPGEGFHPVKKSASGGELSRILLTLRQVIASSESISVFLFDEIDTGIGGETAICTGKALQKVSLNSQVIAITHLPQIAHYANKLINVTKVIDKSIDEITRTISSISEYMGKEKDQYITKMSQLN